MYKVKPEPTRKEVLFMFSKQLSSKLLKIIGERKMTIESLANASGLTREFVSHVANGKQVPTLNSFEKICSALELEPNDLLISDKSKNESKSKPLKVTEVYMQRKCEVTSFHPVCPACNKLLSCDWQSYCDFCGQRLSWDEYFRAAVVFEKPKRKRV